MRRLMFSLSFLLITIYGCAVGIERTGFKLQNKQEGQNLQNCNIAIKYQMAYDTENIQVLGTIKSYEQGASIKCGEIDVLSIFVYDACSIGANVVNILEEKHPNVWSTCYRAKAELLKFKNEVEAKRIRTDEKYSPSNLAFRAKLDEEQFKRRISGGIEAGIMGGIIGVISAPR